MLHCLAEAWIDTALIHSGRLRTNGTEEIFNSMYGDDFLSKEWLHNCIEASLRLEVTRRHYKEVRPHTSSEYRALTEFSRHHHSTHHGAIRA